MYTKRSAGTQLLLPQNFYTQKVPAELLFYIIVFQKKDIYYLIKIFPLFQRNNLWVALME